jgi:hypothetical protein
MLREAGENHEKPEARWRPCRDSNQSLPAYMSDFFFDSGFWGYWHCGHSWPIVPASGDSEDDWRSRGNVDWQGKPKF